MIFGDFLRWSRIFYIMFYTWYTWYNGTKTLYTESQLFIQILKKMVEKERGRCALHTHVIAIL